MTFPWHMARGTWHMAIGMSSHSTGPQFSWSPNTGQFFYEASLGPLGAIFSFVGSSFSGIVLPYTNQQQNFFQIVTRLRDRNSERELLLTMCCVVLCIVEL